MKKKISLTAKQAAFAKFLKSHPDASETVIMEHFEYKSRRAVWAMVEALEKKKAVRRRKMHFSKWVVLV